MTRLPQSAKPPKAAAPSRVRAIFVRMYSVCTASSPGPPVAVANETAGYLLPWLHELVPGRHDSHLRTPNDGRLGYPHGRQ